MKSLSVLPLLALLSTSCLYEAPFVEEADTRIDPAVPGIWVEDVPAGKVAHRMFILAFSETEYLVHYPEEEGLYYRGYPVTVGGEEYVQLQVIGTRQGPPTDIAKPYLLARYRIEGDTLTLSLLNKKVINPSLKTSAALRKALLDNKSREDLFEEAQAFTRARPGN